EIVEGPTLLLITTALARVLPVHLDQPVVPPKRLVVRSASHRAGGRSELPRALVRIFTAGAVVPGVEIWIRNRLFSLMCHDRCHSVRATVAIRTLGLRLARRRAPVRVSHERVFDIGSRNRRPLMPSAVEE